MVRVGFSAVIESWNTMATSLPRTWRISLSLSPTSSRPSTFTEPEAMCPPGGSRPMIDRPVMDLPQPDSPTRPSVSPASMCSDTSPTACTTERLSWMSVDSPLISSARTTGLLRWCRRSAPAQTDVDGVAQGVADEVAGHDGQDQRGTHGVDQPPVAREQVVDAVREHVAPADPGVGEAEAEEAQRCHREDRVGDLER